MNGMLRFFSINKYIANPILEKGFAQGWLCNVGYILRNSALKICCFEIMKLIKLCPKTPRS